MNTNWGEIYYDHFAKFFREPASRQMFRQSDLLPSIQVLAYDRVFKGCMVFASLGLSHYSKELGRVGEIILPCDGYWEKMPTILANALFYMVQEKCLWGGELQ